MNPTDRLYIPQHQWITLDRPHRVGITDYAQDQLGDITFVELPEVGERFEAAETFGLVESLKSINDLYMPVAAEVIEVNEAAVDDPEVVNSDPYGDGWLCEVRPDDPTQIYQLLTASEYEERFPVGG